MTSSIRKTTNTISSSNCKKTTSKRESTIVRAKETHSICKENSYITCIKSPFATDTEKRSETTAIRIDQTINAHSNKETSQTYSALLASWTNICSFWTNKPIPLSLISVGSFFMHASAHNHGSNCMNCYWIWKLQIIHFSTSYVVDSITRRIELCINGA